MKAHKLNLIHSDWPFLVVEPRLLFQILRVLKTGKAQFTSSQSVFRKEFKDKTGGVPVSV